MAHHLLLGVTLVLAATPLEPARVAAEEARAQLDTLRREQLALEEELAALSGQIQALKAARIGSAELDRALKRSQALSIILTRLAHSLGEAERQSEQAHLALLSALEAERTRLHRLFNATKERVRRATLLAQLRALRAEQERVRLTLPPALLPPTPAASGGDDPEDLLEQADALRDGEDRLRQRLRQVEAHLREAREERALLRRVDDFLGAESIFDEQDRQLRLATPTAGISDVEDEGPGVSTENPSPTDRKEPISSIPKTEEPPRGSHQLGELPPAHRRPHVGPVRRGTLEEPDAGDVEALEQLRERLEAQARTLAQRASELEQRARELQ